jgi:putative transposase
MVQRDHPELSISRQCKLVNLSRSAFYYTPVGVDAETLAMMKEIDRVFLYLLAIMDWATRKVLSWRLSNTMHADFCVEALSEAIAKHGPPEIMNTDQGSQFTGSAWIATLTEAGVRISMDGRGRYLDNIFIERLWRSLKQEAIYLEEITDGFQARRVVKDWMAFYNTKRPHSGLDRRTPDDAYWAGLEEQKQHET